MYRMPTGKKPLLRPGIRVIGVSTLETLVAFLNAEDETEALSASVPIETSGEEIYDVDFSEVNGQETMRRRRR